MFKNLIDYLNRYQTIGIFGYGKDGQAFDNFAKKYLDCAIVIIDQKDGDNYLSKLNTVDIVVKSPGISLYNLGIKQSDYNFTSTTQLFLQFFSNITIGITGTKGKSTLSTILYNTLQNNHTKSFLCGNIGIPVFDIIEQLDNKTKVIMELSSHQLESITYSPHISVLINLFPEHLDYYNSCESYYEAKYNIFKYQQKDDIAIINFDKINLNLSKSFKTPAILNVAQNALKYNHTFDIHKGYIHKTTLQILEQIIALLDIPQDIYTKTISEFKTLTHRLEYVGKYDNIHFINDSISTIPQTTIEAVKILKNIDCIIIGGYDRGVSYDTLIEFLAHSDISHIILVSQTGKILSQQLKQILNNTHYVSKLKEAILLSKELTKKDGYVLFSPAASSFDEFKNFEHRGDIFTALVSNKIVNNKEKS